jgi:hypothetical protein
MTGQPIGPAPPEPRCPRCGTPYGPKQEYCLECGLRLGGSPTLVRRLEAAWRERFDFYPGDWIWPALLGLLIAVAGATGAILLGASNGGGGGPIVATKGGPPHTPTTPPATETVALPTVPSGTPTATTAPPAPTTPPPATTSPPTRGPGSLTTWPAARNGFTVVLESIPISAGRSFALARARAAARSGLPQVGVIDSGRFSSLHSGYFVVFSGIYGTRSAADQARITASAKGYPAAYAREIRR